MQVVVFLARCCSVSKQYTEHIFTDNILTIHTPTTNWCDDVEGRDVNLSCGESSEPSIIIINQRGC